MASLLQIYLIITLNVLVFFNTIVIIISLGVIALILNRTNIQIADTRKYLDELESVVKESSNVLQSLWWAGKKVG
jgi:hypothetical protein